MKTYNSFNFIGISIFISSFSMDFSIKNRNEQNGFSDYHANTIPQSSNPSAGKTGAPGENSCVQCHSGSTLPATGVVNVTFSGTNNQYIPGQNYTLTISSTGNVKNGFQMTALNSSNSAAGSFVAGTNTSTTTFNNRNYVRHSVSNGVNSWTFQWNAPSVGQGDVTFYYAFNKTNNNSNTSGDAIYIGNKTIIQDIASNVIEIEELKNSVKMYLNDKNLHINYDLKEGSSVYYCVQDINGKQLDFHNFGQQQIGEHMHLITLTENYSKGVYLFTVFINNVPYTQKLFIE